MMEASPAAPFVVPEPHLLLEILVVALDPPAHLCHADEGGPLGVRRQCREPVLGRLVLARRPFPGGHSTRNHSRGRGLESVRSRWAGRTRGAAKRPLGGALVPSRQVRVFQARGFKLMAKSSAETGRCASSRRKRLPGGPIGPGRRPIGPGRRPIGPGRRPIGPGRRPRSPLGFGASGSWPGDRQVRAAGQRPVEPSTPIAWLRPSALTASRNKRYTFSLVSTPTALQTKAFELFAIKPIGVR